MSDHGFAPYARKFSLNTWLLENGYLVLEGRARRGAPAATTRRSSRVHRVDAVDWSKTRAYGMGFNGLYLNLAGRELDDPETAEDEAGIVQPGARREALLARDRSAKLEA